MQAIHTSPFLRISYQPLAHIIEVRWAGPCDSFRLRYVYHTVADLLRRFPTHRVLFDTSAREIIGADDARWVACTAYQEMMTDRTLALRLAYVVPQELADNFPKAQNQTQGELLHLGAFGNKAEAVTWLLAD